MKYFYLHGMHSAKGCDTFKLLSSTFIDLSIIDLEYLVDKDCNENLKSIDSQILEHLDNDESIALFGNSLGAFYALAYSSFIRHVEICFLFNPVINPSIQLEKYLGKNINKTKNKEYFFSKKNLESYKNYIKIPKNQLLVFLAKDDELIDSRKSMEYFRNNAEIINFEGKHKIQNFEQFYDIICGNIKKGVKL